ncbi:uncharacterized protein [Diabrotica undecimpunctata]|uniref:uncharacterized protein n=1 Tax=Diabrotica undecimpunctata TaxID=50387 RepID=UPI003B63DCE2
MGSGQCCVDEHMVYYAGNDKPHHWNGVALILSKKVAGAVISVIPLSDRVILMKLQGRPVNTNIIQIYAPTSEKPEEDIEEFYAIMDLAKINASSLVAERKPIKKLVDLPIGTPFPIHSGKVVNTKFGKAVLLDLGTEVVFLPHRVTEVYQPIIGELCGGKYS